MKSSELAVELRRLVQADHEIGEVGSEAWDALSLFVQRNHRALELALRHHNALVKAVRSLMNSDAMILNSKANELLATIEREQEGL